MQKITLNPKRLLISVNKQTNSIRDKISKHKKTIIVSIPIVAIFSLYWFAVPQNIVSYLTLGQKNNSEISQLVTRDHPGISSLKVTRQHMQEKERCLIDLGMFLRFACNWFEIGDYEYRGFYAVGGSSFSMPFKVTFSDGSNQGEVVVYDTMADSPDLSPKWKSFIAFFGETGYKKLLYIEKPDWYRDGAQSTDMAGYEYDDLYITCGSDIDNFYYDQFYPECKENFSKTIVHHSRQNGIYLVYYDAQKNEWSTLTKDAVYFSDWVDSQLRSSYSQTLKTIDWSKSPIKTYSP